MNKLITLSLAFVLSIGVQAQDECKERLSFLTTYYKQKAYESAAPSFRYLYKNCPTASKNVYIIGSKVMETLIKKETDASKKAAYLDTLIDIQDRRLKYFPGAKPFKIAAKKANYLLKYKKYFAKEKQKEVFYAAFAIYDSAFANGKEQLSLYDFKMYMYVYKQMIKLNKKNCEEMTQVYFSMSEEIEKRKTSGGKINKKHIDKVDFYAEVCLSCGMLDTLYSKNFESKKADTTWLDNGIKMFSKKKCNDSQSFLALLEERFKSKKTIKSAMTLGRYYLATEQPTKASEYISIAISLSENDSLQQAKAYVLKAKMELQASKISAARSSAQKAISLNKDSYEAYYTMANAIASTKNCNDAFKGNSVYWLAADYIQKAVTLTEKEKQKQRAQKRLAQYRKQFPDVNDIFILSLKEGDSYNIPCLGLATKIRARK